LLAVGTDEEDLAGSDAVVDPDLVCSYLVTYSVRGFLWGEELVPDATMADTGMSAIKRPPTRWLRNMRTRRTRVCFVRWPGGDCAGVPVSPTSLIVSCLPVATGFPARIHG